MFPKSASELEALAGLASEAYLRNKVDLNSSIKKLAMDNDLSSQQIKRVCELANHRVNDSLFKTSQSKMFEFPLANASTVIGEVQSSDTFSNDFGNSQDYLSAPKFARVSIPEQVCFVLKHDPVKVDKEAAKRETISRLRELKRDADHIKTAALRKIADVKNQMYSIVDRMVGSGYKLEDLYEAAKTASDKKEAVQEVFTYIADRMKKEGKIDRALKISMKKIAAEEDLSGADASIGKYPIGDHWVRVVMNNSSMKSNFHILDEARNDAVKADAAAGHISDMLDTVKTIK